MACARDTVCTPSYANLFMVQFEEKYIYPCIKNMSLLYLKCIYDIFIIWEGTKEQLITFINKLNKKKISSQKIPFLETIVYKVKKIMFNEPYTINLLTSNLILILNQNNQRLNIKIKNYIFY